MRHTIKGLLGCIALACLLAGAAQAAPPTVTKTPALASDPINAILLPKVIPGALVDYDIVVRNPNTFTSLGGVVITDSISDLSVQGAEYYVGQANANPVTVSDGILGLLSSGLTFTWSGLTSTTDSISFSCDKGVTFTCTPHPDAAGYDPLITNIRVSPTSSFAPLSGFSLRIRVRIKTQ
jgi:hypothetical protein